MKKEPAFNKIQANTIYTRDELIATLDISKTTFTRSKDEIENEFQKYWNYKVLSLRPRIYQVFDMIQPYVPIDRKKIIREEAHKIIQKQPINTGTNVSRILAENNKKIQKFNYASSTLKLYTSKEVTSMYGRYKEQIPSFEEIQEGRVGYIDRYYWSRLDAQNNTYIPLTDEQINYFYESLKLDDTSKAQAEYITMYRQKEISKEEYTEKMIGIAEVHYDLGIKIFKEKYGFVPILAKHYVEI